MKKPLAIVVVVALLAATAVTVLLLQNAKNGPAMTSATVVPKR